MKTYQSIDAMWYDVIRDLATIGAKHDSRNGGSREIVGWSGRLTDPGDNFLVHPVRKLSASYAAGELLWYLSQDRDVAMISRYAPSYTMYAESGIANGAYGWRWANNPGFSDNNGFSCYLNQFDAAIALLKASPNTRQCVVTAWDSGDIVDSVTGEYKDMPCTLSLQFVLRDGSLSMIASMRSNDAWLGLPYDVYCFTTVLHLMAAALGVRPGTYVHTVGSMHLYDKHAAKIDAAIALGPAKSISFLGYEEIDREMAISALTEPDNDACELELEARAGLIQKDECERLVHGWVRHSRLHDAIIACWSKTVPGFDGAAYVANPNIARGLV